MCHDHPLMSTWLAQSHERAITIGSHCVSGKDGAEVIP